MKERNISFFVLLLALLLCLPVAAWAYTPGKDGAKTVSGTETVNEYAIFSADASAGATSIAVTSIGDLPTLSAGDLIMIYQAQGAAIDTSNTVDYGSITAYNNAGRYELASVTGTAGNTINLDTGLSYDHTASGNVQVIRVPLYTTLTVTGSGSITAPALGWSEGRHRRQSCCRRHGHRWYDRCLSPGLSGWGTR